MLPLLATANVVRHIVIIISTQRAKRDITLIHEHFCVQLIQCSNRKHKRNACCRKSVLPYEKAIVKPLCMFVFLFVCSGVTLCE